MNQSSDLLTDPSVASVGRTGTVSSVIIAIISDRSDKLLWGAAAIVASLVVTRFLRFVVARLEARHPKEERELARLRRGETALALVATATPYVAAIAVIILV